MNQKQTLRPSPTAILNPRCDVTFKGIFTQGTKESNLALKDFIDSLQKGWCLTHIDAVPDNFLFYDSKRG